MLTHKEQVALVDETRAARICFRAVGGDTEKRQ